MTTSSLLPSRSARSATIGTACPIPPVPPLTPSDPYPLIGAVNVPLPFEEDE